MTSSPQAPDFSAIPPDLTGGQLYVAGAGVAGRGIAQLLGFLRLPVCVVDDRKAAARDAATLAKAAGSPETQVCDTSTAARLLSSGAPDSAAVVTSPGWRPDSPVLTAASRAGIPVIGDVELAWLVDQAGVCGKPCTWLAVTGTNGKTTTTAMLAAMMAAHGECCGQRAQAVGNIGVAVCQAIAQEPRTDVLVVELSSFQLHWTQRFHPQVGVLLNLAEDHLDWHGSMAAYAGDKARVWRSDLAVVGVDDHQVQAVAQKTLGAGVPRADFTLNPPEPGQVGVSEEGIITAWLSGAHPVAVRSSEGIDPPGPAGLLDALAATAAALGAGASVDAVRAGLDSFHVAAHRGQVVARGGGVAWIDNSKATNPHAADAALAGLHNVVWIAGGQLKGADITTVITAHRQRLCGAVVLGQDRHLILDGLRRLAPDVPAVEIAEKDPTAAMDQTVAAAARLAEPGATVLLAPAAASLDMYRGMAERGDLFAAAARRAALEAENEPEEPRL